MPWSETKAEIENHVLQAALTSAGRTGLNLYELLRDLSEGRSRSVEFLRRGGGFWIGGGGAFAHRFSLQMALVGVLQQAVEDRIGEVRITDRGSVRFRTDLRGDSDNTCLMPYQRLPVRIRAGRGCCGSALTD